MDDDVCGRESNVDCCIDSECSLGRFSEDVKITKSGVKFE